MIDLWEKNLTSNIDFAKFTPFQGNSKKWQIKNGLGKKALYHTGKGGDILWILQ